MNWTTLLKRKWCLVGFLAVIALVGALVSPAGAELRCIDKDPNHAIYGNLSQFAAGMANNCMCGPTAAVNSFVYLEASFPGIYNRSLIPDTVAPFGTNQAAHQVVEMVPVANTLGNAAHMGTVCPGGTWDDMFMFGKHKYMEGVAKNKTIYAAQTKYLWGRPGRGVNPGPKPAWVQQQISPTWQFLWNNLVDCEDVEILIEDYVEDWGHYLTLVSFCWDDVNEDLVVDLGEAEIDYIDPCGVPLAVKNWSACWQNGPGLPLFINYSQAHPQAEITMAMSESPIPEPATLVLLVTAALCLIGYGWRRRSRAA